MVHALNLPALQGRAALAECLTKFLVEFGLGNDVTAIDEPNSGANPIDSPQVAYFEDCGRPERPCSCRRSSSGVSALSTLRNN